MAASDDLRGAVYNQPVTPRDRVWQRLMVWMSAAEISRYAPDKGTYEGGTVQVPIRLLNQLRNAVEEYRDDVDADIVELPFHVRMREAIRFLWK